jgi:hypothetical protein
MEDWEPEMTVAAPAGCSSFCQAHLWIVPANVAGTWQLGDSELRIGQKFQHVTGRLVTGNLVALVTDGKLYGDEIAFTAAGVRYRGRVGAGGDTMEGTRSGPSDGAEAKWKATRR